MVTTKFIAFWFVFSALCFWQIKLNVGANEIPRDWNALAVLIAQGVGAALAYFVS